MPLHVESCEVGALQVVRTAGHAFRCWKDGIAPALVSGGDFILASRELARELERHAPEGMLLAPAVVSHAPTGIAEDSFVEVLVRDEILPDALKLDPPGPRVWHYQHNALFLSQSLAAALRARPIAQRLSFHVGFSRFAAGA